MVVLFAAASAALVVTSGCGVGASQEVSPAPAFFGRRLFRRGSSRRLGADGQGPARERYEAEEGGHNFVYEYAGRPTGRILNVDDDPAVAALSCGSTRIIGADARLWITWRSGGTPGVDANASRPPLRPGDFVASRRAWSCGPSQAGFLVGVVDVLEPASVGKRITTLSVQAMSPFQAVQDLYIDFTWTFPGRRLESEVWSFNPQLPLIGYNVDSAGVIVKPNIDVGPLTCENCKAELRPTIQFRMETDQALPKRLSMTVSADLNVSLSVGLSQEALRTINSKLQSLQDLSASVGSDFTRVWELVGSDLIAPAMLALGLGSKGLLLPLFALVTDVLEVELLPVFGTDLLLKLQGNALADLKASVALSAGVAFTVSWDAVTGYSATASVDELTKDVSVRGVEALSNITAGKRACLAMRLHAFGSDVPLTSIEGCPELRTFVQGLSQAVVPEIPRELLPNTAVDTGEQFCFEFLSFTTDADLDWLDKDDPYAKVCLFGRCARTPHSCFNGNSVAWPDARPCLRAPSGAATDGVVAYLHFLDDDAFWDDQYTQPHATLLSEASCPGLGTEAGCLLSDISLALYAKGSYARASIKVTKVSERRLASDEACKGVAVSLSLGISSTFGGFDYPLNFNQGGGQQIVDPVRAHAINPRAPVTVCDDSDRATVSSALTRSKMAAPVWLLSLPLLVSPTMA